MMTSAKTNDATRSFAISLCVAVLKQDSKNNVFDNTQNIKI